MEKWTEYESASHTHTHSESSFANDLININGKNKTHFSYEINKNNYNQSIIKRVKKCMVPNMGYERSVKHYNFSRGQYDSIKFLNVYSC